MRIRVGSLSSMVGTMLIASLALAAEPDAPAFDMAAAMARQEEFNKLPDTQGTGSFPSLKEEVVSLPDHVVYRPRDLSKFGKNSLGVIAWGNGGCSADGASNRFHLAEIASHGYLVIANGKIMTGPDVPPGQEMKRRGPGTLPADMPAPTRADQLREAIDWAISESGRKDSRYFERINPKWIAVSGWSCGGVQALRIGSDLRVATIVVHNTGIFSSPPAPMPGMPPLSADMNLGKDALAKLHTPILYVLGGPTDIAYANGMDDYKRIDHVPAMVANLEVGHEGTFLQPNGGAAANVAVQWLDWQLKGKKEAAKFFTGQDCGLCRDSAWTLERKGW